MACGCTPVDLDAVAAAWQSFKELEESAVMTQPTPPAEQPAEDEELTTVYWTGDPEVTAISAGGVDNLVIKNGQAKVPISIAVYLTSAQPRNFSAAPPAKGSPEAAKTPSTPAKENAQE
jgi:hypothetical protein